MPPSDQAVAVVMGRRTFEMGDPDSYVGSYQFQVPIFSIEQAKAVAGAAVVQVVGARTQPRLRHRQRVKPQPSDESSGSPRS